MLARLKDGKIEDVKAVLEALTLPITQSKGYIWNICGGMLMIRKYLFLFRIDDPILAKRFVRKVHAEALKEDPTVNLPLMTYLEEE